MERLVKVNEEVHKGEILAKIYDPYEHTVIEELTAPCKEQYFLFMLKISFMLIHLSSN